MTELEKSLRRLCENIDWRSQTK